MILICYWAHLQPLHWVDEGDGNDGQTEGQYNDGKETKRSVASSEAPDIAIDVPTLQSTRQRRKINKENGTTQLGTETSKAYFAIGIVSIKYTLHECWELVNP